MSPALSRFCMLMVMAGCTRDPGSSAWDGVVRDSAGIQIVDNPSLGLWAVDEAWELREALRVGEADGDPNYQFGEIVGITLGEGGEIFVLDQQTAQVRVFSPDGMFRRTFGRPGAGPGELSSGGVAALLNGPGDTLLVADMGNQRVMRFLESGQAIGSFRVDFVEHGIPLAWVAMSNGTFAVQLHPFPRPDDASADVRDVIVVMDAHGAVRDTLLTIAENPMFTMRAGRPTLIYFAAAPTWTLGDSDAIYHGMAAEYRIGHVKRSGQLVRIIAKPFVPPPVTELDQRILLDAFADLMVRQGATPATIQQYRDEAHFAEVFPAYRALYGGPRSSLWVQRVTPPRELGAAVFRTQLHAGASTWDVFDGDGRLLGTVPMPPRFTPLEFIDDHVYGVWRDELDIQHLMVLRVVEPAVKP